MDSDLNNGYSQMGEQEREESLPLVNYRLAITERKISFKGTEQLYLEKVVALPNYDGLLIFEQGRIMLVNFHTGEIKKDAPFDKNIIKIELYDDSRILYVSRDHKKLCFFNFVTFEPTELMNVSLPTETGLPISERAANNTYVEDLLRDGTYLLVLKETKTIVLLEVKSSYSQHQNEIILTAFREENRDKEFAQVRSSDFNQKQFLFEKLNNRDTVCVFVQLLENAPVEIYLWRVGKNSPGVCFRLTDSLTAIIFHVFPFGNNKAGMILNPSKGSYPILKVFDYSVGNSAQETTTYLNSVLQGHSENSMSDQASNDADGYCVSDVFATNVDQQYIIWERLGKCGQSLEVINPLSNKVTFQQCQKYNETDNEDEDQDEPSKQTSTDLKYLLYSRMDSNYNGDTSKYTFTIYSIVGIKASIMHMMLKQNIVQSYGQEVSKNVLDMLISSQKITEER